MDSIAGRGKGFPYIHSPFSTCRLTDFDHTWRLLAAFCRTAQDRQALIGEGIGSFRPAY